MTRLKKNIIKLLGGIIIVPLLIVAILAVAIYIPPVQRGLIDKATEILSAETGMDVHVGSVSLSFPIDLSVNDVVVMHGSEAEQKDTLVSIESLIAEVELLPLFSGEIMINTFEFENVTLNTGNYVSAACIRGNIERFKLRSRGIDLIGEEIRLNHASLVGADLEVGLLPDTTAADTTATSEAQWHIFVDDISIEETKLRFNTIGDSTSIGTAIKRVNINGGEFDLGKALYSLNSFCIDGGTLTYDNRFAHKTDGELDSINSNSEVGIGGFDPNHIAIDGLNIIVDSIYYCEPIARFNLRQFAMKEKCGLSVVSLGFPFRMDSTMLSISQMKLLMPDSYLEADAEVDMNIIDEANPGKFNLTMDASIGKSDMMLLLSGMSKAFRDSYPAEPIELRGNVKGNMKHIDINELTIEQQTAFKLSAEGSIDNIADLERMKADISVAGASENLPHIEALLNTDTTGSVRIPNDMTLNGAVKADGSRYNLGLTLLQDKASVDVKGFYDGSRDAYTAEINVDSLNIHDFLPNDSLYDFSAYAKAEGEGFDVFSPSTKLNCEATINEFRYGSLDVSNIKMQAVLDKGKARANIDSRNKILNGNFNMEALMSHERVDATLAADMNKVDLYTMRLTEKPLSIGICAHVDVKSDLDQSHELIGNIGDVAFITEKQTYRPAELMMSVFTDPDTIRANVETGDFNMSFNSSGGYVKLLAAADSLMAEMARQKENKEINQIALQHRLPKMRLSLKSGNENPVAGYLNHEGFSLDDLQCMLSTSPEDGLTGRFHLYSFESDSMKLDTIRLTIDNDAQSYIRLHGEMANNNRNPYMQFRGLLDAYLFERKLGADVKLYDGDDDLNFKIGAHAEMLDSGINVRLSPDRPILVNREFNLNKDNYILLKRNGKLYADVDLRDDGGMGVMLRSSSEDDPNMLQDITLSLCRFDLDSLTSQIPYVPHVTGLLNGDFRLMKDKGDNLSMVSSTSIDRMTYEKNEMGDINTDFAYLLREDGTHVVDLVLNRNQEEIAMLNGSYYSEGEGYLDAMLTMARFPLSMVNGFVPDGIIGLTGYADGDLSVKGKTSAPDVNGTLMLDSTHVISKPYGLNMRADNKPVHIEHSKLMLDKYSIYSHNDQPLTINGNLDFSNLDNMKIGLRMRANDYLLINAKKQKGSVAYGKAYVNFFAGINGTFNDLRVRGRLDVLGKTDLTYILRDSPLSTDDRMKELVTFTDFSDTTRVKTTHQPIGGMDMSLTVNVENGSRVTCALNAAQTNYITIEGGGELRMLYTPANDLQLFGRYTVNQGEMKYSLPVIPLKTFTLQKDDYVEFTGDVMNPRLNLTATEQVTAQVSSDDGSKRSVLFNCGVKISQTLNNLGLEFILDAPSDMNVKNDLAMMGAAQKSKLAVTMLSTGLYLDESNNSNFTMNSALSSFLQNEINNITNSAMGSVDINVGMDQNTDAMGQTSTDYSFKFAKRFWNNRFSLVVGGKVSGDNNNSMSTSGNDDSFIDNVSLEYRLDDTAQRNVRVFYNKDANDIFSEKVSEYGAGFMWRKKMNNLSELFKSSKKTNYMLRRTNRRPTTSPDSTLQRPTTSPDSTQVRPTNIPVPVQEPQPDETK